MFNTRAFRKQLHFMEDRVNNLEVWNKMWKETVADVIMERTRLQDGGEHTHRNVAPRGRKPKGKPADQ